jgi:hypothetical protein
MKLPDLLALGRTFAKLTKSPTGFQPAAPLPDLRLAGNGGTAADTAVAAFSRLAIQAAGSATWPNGPDLLRPLRPAAPPAAKASPPSGRAVPVTTAPPRSARASDQAANPAGPATGDRSAAPAPVMERRRWWGRRRGRGPRQGELALAAVRVVRNDLFADDLEFIPRPSPQARGLTLGAERAVPSGGWRGWLAHWANLLGLRRERRP